MTALSAGKNIVPYGDNASPRLISLNLAASEVVYQGSLMGRNSSGNGVKATSTPNIKIVGVATETVTASSTAAATKTTVKAGVFWFVNGDSILDDDIGKVCYAYDDQTVKKSNAAGTMAIAGIIVDVDSTLGVAVYVGPGVGVGAPTTLSYSISYSDAWVYIASVTAYCDLTGTLPAGTIVLGYDWTNVDWVQGSTTIQADLGTAADIDFYVADIGNVDNGSARSCGGSCGIVATAGALRLTLTTAAGTLGAMTAGSATVKLIVIMP
jgi:hypothetical protein